MDAKLAGFCLLSVRVVTAQIQSGGFHFAFQHVVCGETEAFVVPY